MSTVRRCEIVALLIGTDHTAEHKAGDIGSQSGCEPAVAALATAWLVPHYTISRHKAYRHGVPQCPVRYSLDLLDSRTQCHMTSHLAALKSVC